MSRSRFTQLITELSAQPGLGPLAASTLLVAQRAWRKRDVVFPRPGSPTLANAEVATDGRLLSGDLNIGEVFKHGASTSDELDALSALVLIGLAAEWPNQGRDMTSCVLWLETFTGMRCLTAAASVLDGARLRGLAELVLEMLEGRASAAAPISVSEIQVGRAWLASLKAPECAELVERARQLNAEPAGEDAQTVRGDLGPSPRHPVVVAVFAFTGILLLLRGLRALGRLVLLRRTPTSIWLSERGLELFSRQEMLGRVLTERRILVPLEEIRAVEREVRFPRLGLYAGLLALALGTLMGTQLFIDGLRVSGLSLPLIAMGLLLIVCGIVLDLFLSGLGDSLRGRCRLVVTTQHGRGWAVGNLESSNVDRLLTELSTRFAARRAS